MYLMVETDCLQFCIKKETEGSRRYFTLRQTVSGKARLCEVRDASARPGGISMAPKRLRCLRQAGQRSDPQKSVLGVKPEQERDVRDSEIRAASPDQPCQTLPLETQDRNMKDKIGPGP